MFTCCFDSQTSPVCRQIVFCLQLQEPVSLWTVSFNNEETIINHSIDIVCDVSLDRTNTHFDVVHFSKTRDLNRQDTQIGRMEFATDCISFETNYISSGINSIYFEITCNSAEPKHSAERGFQPNCLSQPNTEDCMIGQVKGGRLLFKNKRNN